MRCGAAAAARRPPADCLFCRNLVLVAALQVVVIGLAADSGCGKSTFMRR